METLVPKHTNIECPHCDMFHTLTEDLDLLPVTLECPATKKVYILKHSGPFPKIDSQILGQWRVYENKTEQENNFTDNNRSELISFSEREKNILDYLQSGLNEIQELQSDLSKLSDQMIKDFQEAFSVMESIWSWDNSEMMRFIVSPFMYFHPECDDLDVRSMSLIVMFPKFMKAGTGFPLETRGSFNIQAITPYSQMTLPVQETISSFSDIQIPYEIEVSGKKIIGKDVDIVWNKIEGISLDEDHTEEVPSIFISNNFSARRWLARNGIKPYKKSKIKEKEIDRTRPELSSLESFYSHEWDSLVNFGRMCYFSYSESNIFEFIDLVNSVFRTKPLVISSRTLDSCIINFVPGTDEPNSIPWNEIEFIIIDFDPKWVDTIKGQEVIKKLYTHYSGNLLAVCKDPILDTFEDHVISDILFGMISGFFIDYKSYEKSSPSLRRKSGLSSKTDELLSLAILSRLQG